MKLRKALFFFLIVLLIALGVKAEFYSAPPVQSSIELSGDSLQHGIHAPAENAEEDPQEEATAPEIENAATTTPQVTKKGLC